jgi:putative addiction module component (TIGR02574 family)
MNENPSEIQAGKTIGALRGVSSIKVFGLVPGSTRFHRLDVGLNRSLRYPLYMIDQSLIAKVVSLSPAERLELIGAVWDSLSPDDLPVTDAEKELLDARIADMERNPDDQSPWPDVKARLERLLR